MYTKLCYDPNKYPKLGNECFKQPNFISNKYYYNATSWNTNKRLHKILCEPQNDSEYETLNLSTKRSSSSGPLYISTQDELQPYFNFFNDNKTDKDLITWPSKYAKELPVVHKKLTVEEIADAMILKTSQDIAQVLLNLVDEYDDEIYRSTVEKIKIIFSIREDPQDFAIKINQLSCIPDQIADKYHCDKMTKWNALDENIKLDLIAERKTKKNVAFNSSIPLKYQINPTNNNVEEKWLKTDALWNKLDEMSFVFKDITDIEITKGFYEWLKRKKLPIPTFLNDVHMKERTIDDKMKEYWRQIEKCSSDDKFPEKLPKLNQKKIEDIIEMTFKNIE